MMPLAIRKISGRILIVDDEPRHVRDLEKMLSLAGCQDHPSAPDADKGLDLCERLRPDAVLLDLNMLGAQGVGVLERFAERFPCRASLPIVVLSTDTSVHTKYQALLSGATDFLPRPVDALELVMRLANHLEIRRMHLDAVEGKALFAAQVKERSSDLEAAIAEIVDRLSVAAELRDDHTGNHVERVSSLTARIATQLGVPKDEVDLLRRAARLHDIGKLAIPDAVLLKDGPLDDLEQRIMRQHTTAGGTLLGGSRFPLLTRAEEIALRHHEWWDGTGYPDGLRGEEIPLCARIAAVADTFDSLTRKKPYREAWCEDAAVAEVLRLSGSQFDPTVVVAFESVISPQNASQHSALQKSLSRERANR